MKKEYPYLKQFFEQHKTKHSYKTFVRHRSPERLKQLDEICSNRPYKTRFEEYLKLSDKETFAQKIYKVKERIDVYWFDHDNGAVIGCLFFMVLLLLSLAGKSTFIISLKILSVVFLLFILIFPFYQIVNILGVRKLFKMEKSFPFCYHFLNENKDYRYIKSHDNHYYKIFHNRFFSERYEGLIMPHEISKKFAEECDLCMYKFYDDFKLFFSENQMEISEIINFYNNHNNGLKNAQSKIAQNIEDIYLCFSRVDLFRFSSITKDCLNSACTYIQDSGKIVPEELYQIDFNQFENRVKEGHYQYYLNDNHPKPYIYIAWICLNLFCIGFTGYVFKVKHDLKDRSIASLYQKSYTRYENELRKWENGVFVKIGTSMTDYYRLGEDLSYEYEINGINLSSNSIIGMPRDNHFDFGVSITEYDDTYSDFGYSSQSQYISKQDLIKGYKVVLETYVHENSTSSTQGYARFKTVFTLSFQNEEYKPREPQKSDFNDDVKVTFSDAFKSALGLK